MGSQNNIYYLNSIQEFISDTPLAENSDWEPSLEFTFFQLYYENLIEKMPPSTPEDVLSISIHGNLFTDTSRLLASIAKPILGKNKWGTEDKIAFVKLMAGKQLLDKDRQINLPVLKKLMFERYGLDDHQYQEVVSYWRTYIEANKK